MAVLYDIEGKKVLFIHIPKTGGGSVHNALISHSKVVPEIVGHPGQHECSMVVNPDYMFAVVRNPWDWRSSWYHYIKEGTSGHIYENNKTKNMGFNDHIKWISDEPINNLTTSTYVGVESKLFIKSQSEYINSDVKILRFENLKLDFENYMLELGLVTKLNTHVRKSGNNNYINEYNNDSIDIVRELHNDDIVKFGYNFLK